MLKLYMKKKNFKEEEKKKNINIYYIIWVYVYHFAKYSTFHQT